MNALRGLDEILRCEKKRHGHTIVGEGEPDDEFEPMISEVMGGAKYYSVDDAGPQQVIDEALGAFDMGTISPYLSAFAGGFGGDKKKEEAPPPPPPPPPKSNTTLWVVVGLLGAAVVGGGVFLAARR